MHRPAHVRATNLDRARVNTYIVTAFGPLNLPSAEGLREILEQIADMGTHTRVGVQPSRTSTLWELCREGVPDVRTAERANLDGPAELVERLVQDGTAGPIQLFSVGDYLAVKTSHGLCDARLVLLLLAAILTGDKRALERSMPERFLLLRTTMSWFLSDPRRVRRMLQQPRPKRTDVQWVKREDLPAQRIALESARLPAVRRADMRAWAKEAAPGATEVTLRFAAFARALEQVGCPVSPTAHILVDARRYHASAAGYNGNFSVGMDFHFPAPYDPAALSAQLREALDAGRPLASMSLTALKAQFASPGADDMVAVTSGAMVAYSDLGKLPGVRRMPWRDTDHPQAACAVEPFGFRGVTLMTGEFFDDVEISASFNASAMEREIVSDALHLMARSPIDMLEGTRHVA